MNRFDNKIALVTGGASGIGLAVASRLQQEGARVFTAQRRAVENLNQGMINLQCDLSNPDAVEQMMASMIEQSGGLDVLVNNAGMMMESSIETTSLDMWNKTLAVNLTAPFLLTKLALPHLKKNRGSIVNIGSIEGLGSNPEHAAYSASKAGLHGLTRATAVDAGAAGVRCNAVAPGWIDTDLNNEFIESMMDAKKFKNRIGSLHPVGRTGKTDEVASLVAFLAAEESGFITGQVYTIDGGRMTKLSLPQD